MSDTLILPEFETDLKKQLIEGEYFHTYCPRCKSKIRFYHTCIYADKKHGFILLMKPKQEAKEADHTLYHDDAYIKRYIFKEDEISEKIAILEAGLDDRALEIIKIKLYMQRKDADKIYFYDDDQISKSIWFCVQTGDEKEMLAITLESYQSIVNTLPKPKKDGFYAIDFTWALAYIKQTMKQSKR